jgi:hypothetical protein
MSRLFPGRGSSDFFIVSHHLDILCGQKACSYILCNNSGTQVTAYFFVRSLSQEETTDETLRIIGELIQDPVFIPLGLAVCDERGGAVLMIPMGRWEMGS